MSNRKRMARGAFSITWSLVGLQIMCADCGESHRITLIYIGLSLLRALLLNCAANGHWSTRKFPAKVLEISTGVAYASHRKKQGGSKTQGMNRSMDSILSSGKLPIVSSDICVPTYLWLFYRSKKPLQVDGV